MLGDYKIHVMKIIRLMSRQNRTQNLFAPTFYWALRFLADFMN